MQAVTTADNKKFTINKSNFILNANEAFFLKFFVKFDEIERLPDIEQVILNGINICSSSTVVNSQEPVIGDIIK